MGTFGKPSLVLHAWQGPKTSWPESCLREGEAQPNVGPTSHFVFVSPCNVITASLVSISNSDRDTRRLSGERKRRQRSPTPRLLRRRRAAQLASRLPRQRGHISCNECAALHAVAALHRHLSAPRYSVRSAPPHHPPFDPLLSFARTPPAKTKWREASSIIENHVSCDGFVYKSLWKWKTKQFPLTCDLTCSSGIFSLSAN